MDVSGQNEAIAGGIDLHRLLVQTVRDYAIFALDPRGNVLTWNDGARRLKGYTAGEIVGKHFSAFYPRKDVEAGKPAWELEVAVREGKYEEEGWRVRKDGSLFWANVLITTLRDDNGNVVGFAKVTRDLTERRAVEDELRASEERFRLLVASVKDYGIVMLDPDGRVASWNSGAEIVQGYTADEIVGRHFSVFYPPEDVAAGKPQRELEVAAREGRYEEEGWRVRKDGTRFWANVIVTPLHNAQGRLIGFAKVNRDLTERRAAQARAIDDATRIAEVESANRTKAEFLAAMSHELRTPLNAIGGYAELMEVGVGGPITERQQQYLTRIRNSQQHLLGIITDLLNYSRIEAGHLTYEIAPTSVHKMVETVSPLVEPQAIAKQITMRLGRCDKDVVALADRAKVEQIILNLLGNAVKFTPPGGLIFISCSVEGSRVAVTVKDTGPGIPIEKQAAIFEPFVQLGRNLTSPHEGTGLGLPISRDMARAMKGDVTVQSDGRTGSSFTLWLPRDN